MAYEQLILKRKAIELRLFCFFERRPFDMNWIADLTKIECLEIESWGEILNVEKLANFKNLKKLTLNFGVKIKSDLSFLTLLNPNLEELHILTEDKNPKVDLTPITHFRHLKILGIQYLEKNLESVLPELSSLERLFLRSIPKPKNLDCLQHLHNLQYVVLQRCGFEQIDVLAQLKNVKYLQLWWLNKISNLDFVSQMHGLQFLFIEILNGVNHFPKVADLNKLRRVKITSCKNLNDFGEVARARSIEDFFIQNAVHNVETFVSLITNPSIKNLGIGSSKTTLNRQLSALFEKHHRENISVYPDPKVGEFVFL